MKKKSSIVKLKEELSVLREKLKISQSLIKIGFWKLNRESKLLSLSEEALQILRIDACKTSLSIDEFSKLLRSNKSKEIDSKIKELENDFKDLDFEFILNPLDNEPLIWIKLIANAASINKNNPNAIIGIVQDITEQKKSEQQLLHAKERAEEADILKSAFLANMSHEIRTPLNAIVGFSKLLTNPEIEDKLRNEYSEYIASSANNLLNLIRDIVDVSKIEAGKILIEERVCEVNKILKELRFTFENEKENQSKAGIKIFLNKAIEEENFSIKTDPYRFHQIMMNLIGNALKFIEKGFIEFGYEINESWLQFYVKDTGIGIPDDKKDLIFSRFGQIINNKIKNPGGTGLGLSITKHLVERLGGKIWVESTQGIGTTFYFTLPYKRIKPIKAKSVKSEAAPGTMDIEKIRILAVEDDQINMILLEDSLKTHIRNIILEKATNGTEALEKLKLFDFDLIIMDVRMPIMDGYEATHHIRQDFKYPKNAIPILGLSAHALKEEIEKGKQIGMNDFLTKPITPEELTTKIKILLLKNQKELNIQKEKPKPVIQETAFNNLNLEFLENLFNDDKEKIIKTLKAYQDQVPRQLDALENSCASDDQDKLKNISHSLKSTFKYIGRSDLSELAREIEISTLTAESKKTISEKIKLIHKEWIIIKNLIMEKLSK